VPVRTRSCSTSSAVRTACSALIALGLIGCGEARHGAPPPPSAAALSVELNDFGPLPAVRSGTSTRVPGTRWLTYRSVLGGRVPAYLVEPRGGGPYPAVVFQHGRLGNRSQFLGEARALRRHDITVGPATADTVPVIAGLAATDQVVLSGAILLDNQIQLDN